jgi:hypothetical protein
MEPKFSLGQCVATRGALAALKESGEPPLKFLARHARGDWGDTGKDDAHANDLALVDGSRLLSVYRTGLGVKIWVITEADRSSTCILLPEDY